MMCVTPYRPFGHSGASALTNPTTTPTERNHHPMTDAPTRQNDKTKQLDKIGAEYDVSRGDDEGDADYAERLIYELSVYIEDLWAVQDRIRDLVGETGLAP